MWNELNNCPVCDKEMLKVGIKNHIIGRAKSELFKNHFNKKEKLNHLKYFKNNQKKIYELVL